MAGRLVGVSRILNEAGLIEPFIRHHAALLDQHIILDNGSADGTVEILRALQAEGLAIQVYQAVSPVFAETFVNTLLYNLAVKDGADWVLFLDCDELIHLGRVPEGLRALLAATPGETPCVHLPLLNYVAPTTTSERESNPFLRLTQREAQARVTKVFVRRMRPGRVSIDAGNHGAVVDGRLASGPVQDRLVLAHFPERSPAQAAAKAVIGRLKVIAAGRDGVHPSWNWHYVDAFEAMKRDPRGWLQQAASRSVAEDQALVHDPVPYLGGSLVHTPEMDDAARLLALVIHYAETLAASHGGILDRKRLIRAAILRDAAAVRRLL